MTWRGHGDPPEDELRKLRVALCAAEETAESWRHHASVLGERLEAVEAQRWAVMEQCRGWRERCLQEAALSLLSLGSLFHRDACLRLIRVRLVLD